MIINLWTVPLTVDFIHLTFEPIHCDKMFLRFFFDYCKLKNEKYFRDDCMKEVVEVETE